MVQNRGAQKWSTIILSKVYLEKLLAIDSTYAETKIVLSSLDFHKDLIKKEEKLEVINVSSVNNAAASFAPIWYKNGVLFCSEFKNDSVKKRPKVDIAEEFSDVESLDWP